MSALNLLAACPSCGAEESIDSVISRVIEDDKLLRLVREVIEISLPLGGKVLRYVRLHKPAKHTLRIEKIHALLLELVPDLRRGAVNVAGRDWQAPQKVWADALDEVFRCQGTGTLKLPLQGNGFLYAVITRMSNSGEADAERAREIERRQRAYRDTEPASLADLVPGRAAVAAPAPAPAPAAAEPGTPRGVPDWVKAAKDKLAQSSAGVRAESVIPTTKEI